MARKNRQGNRSQQGQQQGREQQNLRGGGQQNLRGGQQTRSDLSFTGQRGNSSFAGVGPKQYRRTDERITDDVVEKLTADPRIDASQIEVRVRDGIVTMSGYVPERMQRLAAEQMIDRIGGVVDITNDLRVQIRRFEDTNQEQQFQGANNRLPTQGRHEAPRVS